jgi:hypothetical protein
MTNSGGGVKHWTNFRGAKLSASEGRARNKVWEQGWEDNPTSQSRGMVDYWASLIVLRAVQKTKLLYLAEEELTRQNCSCRATQLPSAENNTWDLIAQTSSELQQVQIATCPVDRRNQIQLIGQLSGETTSELPLVTDCPSDQGKWEKKTPRWLTCQAVQ